jgi:hypothetical protein
LKTDDWQSEKCKFLRNGENFLYMIYWKHTPFMLIRHFPTFPICCDALNLIFLPRRYMICFVCIYMEYGIPTYSYIAYQIIIIVIMRLFSMQKLLVKLFFANKRDAKLLSSSSTSQLMDLYNISPISCV